MKIPLSIKKIRYTENLLLKNHIHDAGDYSDDDGGYDGRAERADMEARDELWGDNQEYRVDDEHEKTESEDRRRQSKEDEDGFEQNIEDPQDQRYHKSSQIGVYLKSGDEIGRR